MATFQGTIWKPKTILHLLKTDIKRDLAVL